MLSKFPNSTLKYGAPVSLSPESRYAQAGIDRYNPVGIRGVVERGYGSVYVVWSNGTSNTYIPEDHDLIAEGEPGYMEGSY